jgi:Leucine-rich repeat (LRR) protein
LASRFFINNNKELTDISALAEIGKLGNLTELDLDVYKI